MIFLDTSALIKAYVTEQGTPTVRALVSRFDGRLFANAFVALEVVATLSKKLRGQHIPKHEYQNARGKFLNDFFDSYEIVQISEPILTSAITLADNHRQMSVGAMDFLHVASALALQARIRRQDFVVVSSDQGFIALAQACGLQTFDPETQPFGSLLAIYGWRDAN